VAVAISAFAAAGKEAVLFLKKKHAPGLNWGTKKTLLLWSVLVKPALAKLTKVFWFFFSKKNGFL
jgi:hypothetical protein